MAKFLMIVTGCVQDENGEWPLGPRMVDENSIDRLVEAGAIRLPYEKEKAEFESEPVTEENSDVQDEGSESEPDAEEDEFESAVEEEQNEEYPLTETESVAVVGDFPSESSLKDVIVQFMTDNKIDHNPDDKKAVLLQQIAGWRKKHNL